MPRKKKTEVVEVEIIPDQILENLKERWFKLAAEENIKIPSKRDKSIGKQLDQLEKEIQKRKSEINEIY